MDALSDWWDALAASMTSSLAGFGAYLPNISAAIAIMFIGWIVARILRTILLRSGHMLNDAVGRFGRSVTPARVRVSHRLVALAAKLGFWIVILVSAAVAAQVTGLDAFSAWLDRILDYLPTLVAGLLIAFAGYLLSTLVREAVATTLGSVHSIDSELAGFAAQSAVFLTALVIGLDQIGIDVTFLIILAAVLLGGALLGLALAFGFGAREFVSNLIAARQLRNTIAVGDRARIADVEGRILEIDSTTVVLLDDKERILVPAARFQSSVSRIVSGGSNE